VDILCTHVAPAVSALARDVVGGKEKGSQAVLDYLVDAQPQFHYFGDIHQPQASSWRVGDTRCRNVGYFRATGRAVSHGA
jgi:Icc-related predicted phosphoesterase